MRNLICRLISRDNRTAEEALTDGHIGINSFQLRCKSNGQLAQWQANHKNEPAKVILAEQEWQNRRLSKQIRAGFFVSLIGVGGAIAGVILGWQLRSYSMDEHIVQYHSERSADGKQEHKQHGAVQKHSNDGFVNINATPQPRPSENTGQAKQKQPNATAKP